MNARQVALALCTVMLMNAYATLSRHAPRALSDARFAVVDVETTGIDSVVDRVVEVACAIVQSGRRLHTFSSLVHPNRPIPATASAIHHITDRHVRDAPTLAVLEPKLVALCADAIVVAHNAAFDLRFLPFLAARPVLCSLRLAQRVVPDAPNHKNQVLRYHLGIDDDLPPDAVAHRAAGDVEVTSRLLVICVERYLAAGGIDDAAHFVRTIAAPRSLDALPFGRHRGVRISEVPSDYLHWLRHESKSASADARYTADRELARRSLACA